LHLMLWSCGSDAVRYNTHQVGLWSRLKYQLPSLPMSSSRLETLGTVEPSRMHVHFCNRLPPSDTVLCLLICILFAVFGLLSCSDPSPKSIDCCKIALAKVKAVQHSRTDRAST
jgi:hypothetical protein